MHDIINVNVKAERAEKLKSAIFSMVTTRQLVRTHYSLTPCGRGRIRKPPRSYKATKSDPHKVERARV